MNVLLAVRIKDAFELICQSITMGHLSAALPKTIGLQMFLKLLWVNIILSTFSGLVGRPIVSGKTVKIG